MSFYGNNCYRSCPPGTGKNSRAPSAREGFGNRGRKAAFDRNKDRSRLWTFTKKSEDGHWVPLHQYEVGTAVKGLPVYPLGKGKVTAIAINPWWYPTAYSRQVFRERGIDLPRAVPPGQPLNYMGAVKISLSHRTWKGAIYRIHGNNNPGRVGRRVTGGCFVMFNEDILELARTISVGTEVDILP